MKKRQISKGQEELSALLQFGRGQRGLKPSKIILSTKKTALEKLANEEAENPEL